MMKKTILIMLSAISIILTGCGLSDPNYINCRDAIKDSGLLWDSDKAGFLLKEWYTDVHEAKTLVGTTITHYDPDVEGYASVACMVSTNGERKANGGYDYERVLILGKDPTFTQQDINNIKYLREVLNDPSYGQEDIDTYGSDNFRYERLRYPTYSSEEIENIDMKALREEIEKTGK